MKLRPWIRNGGAIWFHCVRPRSELRRASMARRWSSPFLIKSCGALKQVPEPPWRPETDLYHRFFAAAADDRDQLVLQPASALRASDLRRRARYVIRW